MCLITEKKRVKIAKEDIPVWKILNSDMTSYIRGFKYTKNILYKQQIELVDEELYKTLQEKNYICPSDEMDAKYLLDKHNWSGGDNYNPNLIYITKGLHSYLSIERAKHLFKYFYYDSRNLVEFIIPKGSRYYTDATGLCVSNQIIMKKH